MINPPQDSPQGSRRGAGGAGGGAPEVAPQIEVDVQANAQGVQPPLIIGVPQVQQIDQALVRSGPPFIGAQQPPPLAFHVNAGGADPFGLCPAAVHQVDGSPPLIPKCWLHLRPLVSSICFPIWQRGSKHAAPSQL